MSYTELVENVLIPISIGVLASLFASFLFLIFLGRKRPKLEISKEICWRIDEKGRKPHSIKVINLRKLPATNVRAELRLIKARNVPSGSLRQAIKIKLTKDELFELGKYDKNDEDYQYEFRFRTFENLEKLLHDPDFRYLRFRVLATHPISGFNRAFEQRYYSSPAIKQGDFQLGSSFKISKDNAIPLNKSELINFINELNSISSPTDNEERLIECINEWCKAYKLPTQRCGNRKWATVDPLYIGDPSAKYVLITHCDRVEENHERLIEHSNEEIEGKLDNTSSLALCLILIRKYVLQTSDAALLITTSEEKAGLGYSHGGRGFIEYLDFMMNNQTEDFESFIDQKNFICIDVRPLDKNNVKKENGSLMNIGDGIVLRVKEARLNLEADRILIRTVQECAKATGEKLVDFAGGGTTELGRGWEKLLGEKGLSQDKYHIVWIQPPVRNYHTKNERMSFKDLKSLWNILEFFVVTYK